MTVEYARKFDPEAVDDCPFCGGHASLVRISGAGGHNEHPPYCYVQCTVCKSQGPSADDFGGNYHYDAIRRWNMRAP